MSPHEPKKLLFTQTQNKEFTFTGRFLLGPSFPLSSCRPRTRVLVHIWNTNICRGQKQKSGSEPDLKSPTDWFLKAGLTDAAAVAGATHPVPAAASAPAAAGLAAGVGGAFGGDVTVGALPALEVTAALKELRRKHRQTCVKLLKLTNLRV